MLSSSNVSALGARQGEVVTVWPVHRVSALAGLALLLVAGCGSSDSDTRGAPSAAPPTTSAVPAVRAVTSTVAHATGPRVAVYAAPGDQRPTQTLANPQDSGAPLVFLVRDQRPGWFEVLLPVRPNGSTGWIRMADVTTTRHDFRILVELKAHRITVYKGSEVILHEPIAVGTRDTPTPGGIYYTKELILPADESGRYIPDGPYGPYAYGLSGFSNVLKSFAGGDGVVGIHGTNDPSSLGKDVSHGCIRMSNEAITRLHDILPIAVPVEVRP
jgi:lipoprotein-anchoring transpeptidase ErfK/SrfK